MSDEFLAKNYARNKLECSKKSEFSIKDWSEVIFYQLQDLLLTRF